MVGSGRVASAAPAGHRARKREPGRHPGSRRNRSFYRPAARTSRCRAPVAAEWKRLPDAARAARNSGIAMVLLTEPLKPNGHKRHLSPDSPGVARLGVSNRPRKKVWPGRDFTSASLGIRRLRQVFAPGATGFDGDGLARVGVAPHPLHLYLLTGSAPRPVLKGSSVAATWGSADTVHQDALFSPGRRTLRHVVSRPRSPPRRSRVLEGHVFWRNDRPRNAVGARRDP
jgi:hypothetical protein